MKELSQWWRNAVIYQVYPRSFSDGNGDGMGDLPGITARLDHLRDLGVDAVWISPFYPSPQADAGYDVADYCDVEQLFGSLADADALVARAHELGLRVLVDLVPNHSSDEHPWFQRALAAEPGSPERDWYMFRDIDPENPDTPPNNWECNFGGSAWSKAGGQWYLHIFDTKQPDLNWQNPAVREAFRDILRFWLDRGVDGFRIDVAHGMIKVEGLPDISKPEAELNAEGAPTSAAPYWDQDGVHEIYRDWRKVLDSYEGDRIMVAEAWVEPPERLARYVRPDELHQTFNFPYLDTPWYPGDLRAAIAESYRSNDLVGAPTTWVLSNHDVIRHATRLGLDREHFSTHLNAAVPTPDPEVGLRRARAATTLMLGLPGSAYIYQGEELGLPEVLDLPASVRQDPNFHRTNGERLGRDGCRVPLPWKKDEAGFGFSLDSDASNGSPWLPQPDWYGDYAVDAEQDDPTSTLNLYRRLLQLRRERGLGEGTPELLDAATVGEDLVAVDVRTGDTGEVTRIVANLGDSDWTVPDGWKVLLSSAPGENPEVVHTDCAVWLASSETPLG